MADIKVPTQPLVLLAVFIVYPFFVGVYYVATTSLYGFLGYDVPILCTVGVCCAAFMFVGGGIFTIMAFACGMVEMELAQTCCYFLGGCTFAVCFFGMISSFLLNLWYMANLYPYGCEFYDYSGELNITLANLTTHRLYSFNGTTDEEGVFNNKSWERDWDLVVDCNIRMEMFWVWAGGRESLAILAHCFPLIWMVTLVLLAKVIDVKDVWGGIAADIVDLQDFFLLLLEDDLIVAYWEPALEGDAPKSLYWLITVLFFMNGFYMLFWPFVSAFLLKLYPSDKKTIQGIVNIVTRLASLLLCEIPFFWVRVYLSNKCNIIASSLVVKNVLSGCNDVHGLYNIFTTGKDSDSSDSDSGTELARLVEHIEEPDLDEVMKELDDSDGEDEAKRKIAQDVIDKIKQLQHEPIEKAKKVLGKIDAERQASRDEIDLADTLGVS